MGLKIKIGLYVFFIACMIGFAYRFQADSKELGKDRYQVPEDVRDVNVKEYGGKPSPENRLMRLLPVGLGFLVASAGFAVLLARDISSYFGMRFAKFLENQGDEEKDEDYEEAEQEWANGHYLEAIQGLRDYLKKNPKGRHAAIRIAEIYEDNLQNYLAAALEYEEVLKYNLPPERWGWCAIHLCNLYSKYLDQPEKAVALLHRICREYGRTSAAAKARERLSQIGEIPEETLASEGEQPKNSESSDSSREPNSGNNLPPGFAPKK